MLWYFKRSPPYEHLWTLGWLPSGRILHAERQGKSWRTPCRPIYGQVCLSRCDDVCLKSLLESLRWDGSKDLTFLCISFLTVYRQFNAFQKAYCLNKNSWDMLYITCWIKDQRFSQSINPSLMISNKSIFLFREKVTKPKAQIGFIKFVLLPMFDAVARLFPRVSVCKTDQMFDAVARLFLRVSVCKTD